MPRPTAHESALAVTQPEKRYMLRFPCPLTAAASVLFVYCLEVSSDELIDAYESDEDFVQGHPLSAKCFTRELARATLLAMLEKLQCPEEYIPTDYHWLLLYECLQIQLSVLNDIALPCLIEQLQGAAHADDTPYLSFPGTSQGCAGCHIDFDALVDRYFWDTDFLLDAEPFAQLDADSKKMLGFTEGLFGVVHGLLPHPDELVLRRSDECRHRQTQGEDEEV